MKVVCIGRNYAAHAAELGNEVPAEPVIFIKPSTAVVTGGEPFSYPDFSTDVHFECELVLRICRDGKAIEERFAHRYYDRVGLGIDFTARDLQAACKAAGLPWEKAKAFDGSAVVGEFVDLAELDDPGDLAFELEVDGELRQRGRSSQMLFGFDRLVAEASRYFRLEDGDLLFTGTPEGVGPVRRGQHLVGRLAGRPLLSCRVK